MKKYLLYIVIFLIGVLAGMWAHRQYHFRDITEMSQNDTIVVFDTMKYSRLYLATNSYRLDVPNIGIPEVVYIPYDSTTIIYRDSIRYVKVPRQFFYTRTNEAEIFHSGIDSRIDSLNVYLKNTSITHVVKSREKKHSIGIGIEANYSASFNMPVQLEYSYMVKPWMSLYGYAEYELFRKQFGIGAGTRISIEW